MKKEFNYNRKIRLKHISKKDELLYKFDQSMVQTRNFTRRNLMSYDDTLSIL
jgi:hypothetical protein